MSASIFISAKSEDYPAARQVYQFLVDAGIACFFSDQSLQRIGESEYKTAIDKALDEATHLVLVTSCIEHAESRWVRYEWNSFDGELLSGRKSGNIVVVLSDGMNPAALPYALRRRQTFPFPEKLVDLPSFLGAPDVAQSSADDRPPVQLPPRPAGRLRVPQRPATLVIERKFAFGGMFNAVRVFMNGIELGKVKAGRTGTFHFMPSPDGQNKLRVKMILVSQAEQTFEAFPNEIIHAQVAYKYGFFSTNLELTITSIR